MQCEELIQEEFGLQCNFEVMDAVQKLERLGIITRVSSYILFYFYYHFVKNYTEFYCIQDSIGRICCVPLKRANEIIGATTEELVLKARQS